MTWQTALLQAISLMVTGLTISPVRAAEFATKEEAVTLAKRAVVFIKEKGEAKAYAEFSRKGSQFHDRDLYITVLGLDGRVLAPRQRAEFIGKNLIDAKDPDGKLSIKERSDLALHNASFWQKYKFMNPATQKVGAKDMYCERLGETNVCGGVYGSRRDRDILWVGGYTLPALERASIFWPPRSDLPSERQTAERAPNMSGEWHRYTGTASIARNPVLSDC